MAMELRQGKPGEGMSRFAVSASWSARAIDPARLEAVKWLAVAAMVLDHVNIWLLSGQWPVLDRIGDFAFPAFALAFGVGLASSRAPQAVASRLLLWGVAAQAAWWAAFPSHPLNVLLGFGACAAMLALLPRESVAWRAAGWVVLLFVGAAAFEGGGYLVGLVALSFEGVRCWRSIWPAYGVGALWAALTMSLPAAVAAIAVAAWPRRLTLRRAPRGALAAVYAGHLFALAALRGLQ